jgi:hypothetical protein
MEETYSEPSEQTHLKALSYVFFRVAQQQHVCHTQHDMLTWDTGASLQVPEAVHVTVGVPVKLVPHVATQLLPAVAVGEQVKTPLPGLAGGVGQPACRAATRARHVRLVTVCTAECTHVQHTTWLTKPLWQLVHVKPSAHVWMLLGLLC